MQGAAVDERKRCFRSLLHTRVSGRSADKNSSSTLAVHLWSGSGSTEMSRSFWVVFWFCQRFECTHEWLKWVVSSYKNLTDSWYVTPVFKHNSQQAPKVFNYLCKEEHLENPRAWKLNLSTESWRKTRRGWDSDHQHWSFCRIKIRFLGIKIRFVRVISSAWFLLRDISSPRLS